jgi:hypothetical protein
MDSFLNITRVRGADAAAGISDDAAAGKSDADPSDAYVVGNVMGSVELVHLIWAHLPLMYRITAREVCLLWAGLPRLDESTAFSCKLDSEAELLEHDEPLRAMELYRVSHLLLDGRISLTTAFGRARRLGMGLGAEEAMDVCSKGAHSRKGFALEAAPSANDVLGEAVLCGDVALVRLLLDGNASVESSVGSPPRSLLRAAVSEEHQEMVLLLLMYGADLQREQEGEDVWNGQQLLHWAAAQGYVEVVRALLDRGADGADGRESGPPRYEGQPGPKTPLHTAIEHGRAECARLLLARGAPLPSERPFKCMQGPEDDALWDELRAMDAAR